MIFGVKLALYSIKKEIDSGPIFKRKYLKTRIKSVGDEATGFKDKQIPMVDSNYTCLAVVLINFVLRKRWTLLSSFS